LQPNPITHLDGADLHSLDEFRIAHFSSPPERETELLWTVYLTTAYEADKSQDHDPPTEGAMYGLTEGSRLQISTVWLETAHDHFFQRQGIGAAAERLTAQSWRARIAVHELGHQFIGLQRDLVAGHRNDDANILQNDPIHVPDDVYYFHPIERARLRLLRDSPGKGL
jgi:hypothetical protein